MRWTAARGASLASIGLWMDLAGLFLHWGYGEAHNYYSAFAAACNHSLSLTCSIDLEGEAGTQAWANTLLGWPVTIFVLVVSDVFGIWRLQNLGGPGVEEFEEEKDPPWEGQKRGF